MEICTREQLIKVAAQRWKNQYGDRKLEIYNAIVAAGEDGDKIDAATGNKSWTHYFCESCQEYFAVAMRAASGTYLCARCTAKAARDMEVHKILGPGFSMDKHLARLGAPGTEQFTVTTSVDEKVVCEQKLHFPFMLQAVRLSGWRTALKVLFGGLRVEFEMHGSDGARNAIEALNPHELEAETQRIALERLNERRDHWMRTINAAQAKAAADGVQSQNAPAVPPEQVKPDYGKTALGDIFGGWLLP